MAEEQSDVQIILIPVEDLYVMIKTFLDEYVK